MDSERLTLTYPDAAALLAELRAGGQTCALGDIVHRGLRGRGFRDALERALEESKRGERVAVTCEVVYGHAWKGAPKNSADSVKPVQFHRLPS
jgi:malonyl-CoA O-methyltransferase